MLHGNQSIAYFSPSNIIIWITMSFQAGLLNIGAFLAGHRFVSHVTGFATFFGYDINNQEMGHAIGMLVVPLFFLIGAMISGYFVDLRLKFNKRPKYYITFAIMFALNLIVLTGGMSNQFGEFGHPFELNRNYALLILLCLVCGIQNGTISTVSKSVIRTTHLTGITTDLGLGIMRIIYKGQLGDTVKDEGKLNLVRIGLIVFFTLGSVSGAFIFSNWKFAGFIIPTLISGILFTVMIYFQLNPKESPK